MIPRRPRGEGFRDIKDMIASVTAEKDRDMDEAVEQVIAECRQGLHRAVLEVRAKFEAEAAEGRKRVIKEAVSALKERHNSKLRKAVNRYIVENKDAAAARPD